ncbi:cobalt transporter CbiM [Thermochromatium tepidum]|jgi:ABC-type Co2+ transport system, permease component|uniref:Cobalt transporter CbiM n=1 Tax=Thermochromatium tepidum ATCC 43061 TaxID=316276 RepID=A0A6I6DXK5_THETI|nr:cobalt transporter CbiM [Thermochromatium tepidum]QGU32311.1 cobalt transporter CbiM [Thermochromatium tepidum ATCC 43061]
MAHIPEGVLTPQVLIGGGVMTASLLTLALRRIDYDRLPHAAVLSAAFFVSSLISVPLGPTSVHLLLNGLMGLLLGWTAVPAILVALALQAAFFGFGGPLVLGVNTLNMALPALMCAWLLAPALGHAPPARRVWIGFGAGLLGVMLTGMLVAATLALSGEPFRPAAKILALTYPPLALVEGLITATIVGFLQRVAPEILSPGANLHD